MNVVEPIRNKKDLRKVENILLNESGEFGLRNLLICLFGTNCGLRISDILNLDVGDVKNRSSIELTEIKTGKRKKFPINNKLKPLIQQFTKDRNNSEPLFVSRFGYRMERTQCYKILNKACKKAGIDYKIGTHTLPPLQKIQRCRNPSKDFQPLFPSRNFNLHRDKSRHFG